MSIPKHYVIKDGKLKEIRGYKDDVCIERWEIVYDEEDIPVGLRPLSPEEVVPVGWMDRFRKIWRKPKPLTQILSIDFIGLIQYIGLINKIKKVVTIEEIEKILEIINIKKIDEIREIKQMSVPIALRKELIANGDFINKLAGWYNTGVTWMDGADLSWTGYVVKFLIVDGAHSKIQQEFGIPIDHTAWGCTIKFWLRATEVAKGVLIEYYYSDDTSDSETIVATLANTWELKTMSPTPNKKIISIYIRHGLTYTHTSYIGHIMTVF